MKYRKSLIGLSIFMVLAVAVSWMVYVTLQRQIDGATNSYSALFTDVSGLHNGDDVRVAGVRVGRVEIVKLEDVHARVVFRVHKNQPIFTNTTAAVNYQNIIGQRYLALTSPGPGGRLLNPGEGIPLQRTTPSFDISNLLNGFEPLFTVLDPEKVDNLSNAIIEAFQGDQGSLLSLITQTSDLAQTLSGQDDVLGETITNLNDVVANLSNQTDNVQRVIRQTQETLNILDGRRDELVASTGAITHTIGRLAKVVDGISPDLQQLLRREPGWAATMLGKSDQWAYMMQNFPLILKGLARMSQGGSYADVYPCNVNMRFFAFIYRVVPALIKLASPGNVIQNSPMCR